MPGKVALTSARSQHRNEARNRKQNTIQVPRQELSLRGTFACVVAEAHQAKGAVLAIGVNIPLIPVSYCFIDRDARDEGEGPLRVGKPCPDLHAPDSPPAKTRRSKHSEPQRSHAGPRRAAWAERRGQRVVQSLLSSVPPLKDAFLEKMETLRRAEARRKAENSHVFTACITVYRCSSPVEKLWEPVMNGDKQ